MMEESNTPTFHEDSNYDYHLKTLIDLDSQKIAPLIFTIQDNNFLKNNYDNTLMDEHELLAVHSNIDIIESLILDLVTQQTYNTVDSVTDITIDWQQSNEFFWIAVITGWADISGELQKQNLFKIKITRGVCFYQ